MPTVEPAGEPWPGEGQTRHLSARRVRYGTRLGWSVFPASDAPERYRGVAPLVALSVGAEDARRMALRRLWSQNVKKPPRG